MQPGEKERSEPTRDASSDGPRGPVRRTWRGTPLRPLPRRDPAERRAVDWWVRVVPVVLVLHLALLAVLRARLGPIGLWVWYAGPVLIAAATAVLLVGSLLSARLWKHGVNRWHVLGYAGLIFVIFTLPTYEAYPSSYDDRPSGVRFRLPLDGPVTVAWGGEQSAVNYHVFLPDQRWAYDLLVTRDGRSFAGPGTELEHYYAYGLPVRAPASGVVFAARNDEPEVAIGEPRWGLAGLGNHVGLEVAADEYLFIGHLQPGSVTVEVGDRVTAGQVLGDVGNSGNSSEPHVHLHLQDSKRVYFGEGIPFFFHHYEQGGMVVPRGMPEGGRRGQRYVGQIVERVTASAPAGQPR